LDSLWGLIDNQHNALIASKIAQGPVLDVGCGYGSLVAYLTERRIDVEGIDPDEEAIRIARQRFPQAKIRGLKAETLDEYSDGRFGAIVLKDALHHLTGEGDVDVAFRNFRRILAPNGRLVILDPNPMAILRIARRIAGHKDFETTLDFALKILADHGFKIMDTVFSINRSVALLNRFCSAAAVSLGLGPYLCWRYLIHAEMS
jgi:SAM-dependent methyltransferase